VVEIRRPKKPYDEHRKEFAAARGLGASVGGQGAAPQGEPGTVGEELGKAALNEAPAPALNPVKPAGVADTKLRLKFTVNAPLPGASAYFDRAVALMGDGKALRLVLARAFDQLEASVAAGEKVELACYAVDPARSTNTSRHVSAALHGSAKAALDPMDLLPPGGFGRELAMVALARYLARAS
jgi:hypothetical protein